jgi:hypothetical protein
VGVCTVAAEQPGNPVWAAAQTQLDLLVSARPQVVAFDPVDSGAPLTVGGTVTARASASSGLPVLYTSLTPAVCGVDPSSGLVSGLGAGACTVAANQAGDTRWAAAAQVQQTLSATLASQTLAFGAAPTLRVGGSATVRAVASSGLPVVYSSLTPAVCGVDPSSGLVSGFVAGACTLAANQAGNTRWAAAAQVQQTLGATLASQTLVFGAAPTLRVGGSATVQAVASSGLSVVYSSLAPAVCSVQASSGVVTGLAPGTCTLAANQPGDARWAPAPQALQTSTVAPNPHQTVSFSAAPTLTLGGTATVSARASSGLPVTYSSLTPTVCSVNLSTGLVSSFSLGDCTVAANQAGNASHNPAPQAVQTLAVQAPAGITVPGIPQGVTAKLDDRLSTVLVGVSSVDSGGTAISVYTVVSIPAAITVTSSTLPVKVNCPTDCSGYAFAVHASNALGRGGASAATPVLTLFEVVTTFYEPDTQPRNTLFSGTFTLNSTTGAVLNLIGTLTESMSGNASGSAPYYDMTQVTLAHPLQTWFDTALDGTFAATFAKNTSATFSTLNGNDGWSPAAGIANGGIYAGFPAPYSSSLKNSSVLIFVPRNPFDPLTPAQINKLAYADCAPGGMMGAVCMTGTSVAGYGSAGTMSGYPVSQTIRKR